MLVRNFRTLRTRYLLEKHVRQSPDYSCTGELYKPLASSAKGVT